MSVHFAVPFPYVKEGLARVSRRATSSRHVLNALTTAAAPPMARLGAAIGVPSHWRATCKHGKA